jgi:tetratricopeptide (TPR) repeat protein
MMKRQFLLALVLIFSLTMAAMAQQMSVSSSTNLPASVTLEGFQWVHQGTNRCSAAALTIHLSYFMPVTLETYQSLAAAELNTWGADASVRIEEMAAAAQTRGFGAVVRRGGTVDMLRRLVAAGFPVLVENSYYEGDDLYRDWLSHNRVLIGYDDSTQLLYFMDSLLGYPEGEPVSYSYADYDTRWKAFNRDYLVIYNPADEATIQTILADQWDAAANWQWASEQAQAEIDAGSADSFTYFNLGSAQVNLGLFEQAAASYDTARSYGLPMRMLWYEFGPFEAYLGAGRYEDVIALANQQIATAGDSISVEEWYYYAALAYQALGNTDRAQLNLEVAIARNRNFTQAAEALEQLKTNP